VLIFAPSPTMEIAVSGEVDWKGRAKARLVQITEDNVHQTADHIARLLLRLVCKCHRLHFFSMI
jgi:hypothetical protein